MDYCRAAWHGRHCCLRRLTDRTDTEASNCCCRRESTPGVALLPSLSLTMLLSLTVLPLLPPMRVPSSMLLPLRSAGIGVTAFMRSRCCSHCWRLLSRGEGGAGASDAGPLLRRLRRRLLLAWLLSLALLAHAPVSALLPAGSCCPSPARLRVSCNTHGQNRTGQHKQSAQRRVRSQQPATAGWHAQRHIMRQTLPICVPCPAQGLRTRWEDVKALCKQHCPAVSCLQDNCICMHAAWPTHAAAQHTLTLGPCSANLSLRACLRAAIAAAR